MVFIPVGCNSLLNAKILFFLVSEQMRIKYSKIQFFRGKKTKLLQLFKANNQRVGRHVS